MGTLILLFIPATRLASTMKLALTLLLVVAASASPNKVAVNRGANGLDWTAAMRGQTREECIADAISEKDSCLDKTEEKTTACKARGYPDGERRCSRFKHDYRHYCIYKFQKKQSSCQ